MNKVKSFDELIKLAKTRIDRWLASIGVLAVNVHYFEKTFHGKPSHPQQYDEMREIELAFEFANRFAQPGVAFTTWHTDTAVFVAAHVATREFFEHREALGSLGDLDYSRLEKNMSWGEVPDLIIMGFLKRDELPDGQPDSFGNNGERIEAAIMEALEVMRDDITDPNWQPPDHTGDTKA